MCELKCIGKVWHVILDWNHRCVYRSPDIKDCLEFAKLESLEVIPTGWVKG